VTASAAASLLFRVFSVFAAHACTCFKKTLSDFPRPALYGFSQNPADPQIKTTNCRIHIRNKLILLKLDAPVSSGSCYALKWN